MSHICDCRFNSTTELEEHTRNSHRTKIKFVCEVCEETTSTKEELNKHIEEKHVKCTVCNQVFTTSSEQQAHIESQHKMKCNHCDYNAESRGDLDHHIDEKHMKVNHTYKCQVCDKNLRSKEDLDQHNVADHSVHCPFCKQTFVGKDSFVDHFKVCMNDTHYIKCTICPETLKTNEELGKHMKEKHTHLCPDCGNGFPSKNILEDHIKEVHVSKCEICSLTFAKASELEMHVLSDHTFKCCMCNFEGNSVSIMEEHILDKHCFPGRDGKFTCDECDFTCENREEVLKHFKAKHDENSANTDIDEKGGNDEEKIKLKDELRNLQNNFQRLEALFQEAMDEANKKNSDYEAKLLEANEKTRLAQAENEELRERVDVLFKLGRGYINKKEKSKQGDSPCPIEISAQVDNVQIEDDDHIEEDLVTWSKNKFRGFRRAGPTSVPQPNSKTSSPPKAPPKAPPPKLSSGSGPTSPAPERSVENVGRKMYCHFYSNFGKCLFEDRTGKTCKFLHENAPNCHNGMACNRHKCMFKHPQTSRNNFLSPRTNFPMNMNRWQNMNPWQNINPWLNQNPGQEHFPPMWNSSLQNKGSQKTH